MKNPVLESIKLGLILMVVCSVAAGTLGLTYAYTAPIIKAQQDVEIARANQDILKIFGEGELSLSPKEELVDELKEKFPELETIFEITSNGEIIGTAIKMAPKGYGGPIAVAVAINPEGNLVGIKVLDVSKETAGIGTKVMSDEAFLAQFSAKKVSDPFEVKKDVDAISGATISSKAVAKGVREACEIFTKHIKVGK